MKICLICYKALMLMKLIWIEVYQKLKSNYLTSLLLSFYQNFQKAFFN